MGFPVGTIILIIVVFLIAGTGGILYAVMKNSYQKRNAEAIRLLVVEQVK